MRVAATLLVALSHTASSLVAQTATVELHVTRKGPAALVTPTLLLRSTADPAVANEIPVTNETTLLREAPGSSWELRAAAGWWTPPRTITFPAAGESRSEAIDVWRTGIVKGQLTAGEADITLPKSIALTVESPPVPSGSLEIARGTKFECDVAADGKWSCELPATTLDLVLRQKGFTPHYRWGVAISTDTPRELGTFSLRKGASLTAWLDRDTLRAAKQPPRARLVRYMAATASQNSVRLLAPVAEATFNNRGAVQLAPLPAGTYVLEVSAPGFATTRIAPVEIYAASESVFRKPIALRPPHVVTIAIEPHIAPDGKPWTTRWSRNNDLASGFDIAPPLVSAASREGVVTLANQEPGSFDLEVLDASGNRMASRQIVIADESQAHIDVKIDATQVEGKLRLGDQPIAATLFFGGNDGPERIKFTSDSEGKFHGSLPYAGEWRVEVTSDDPRLQAATTAVVKADERVDVRLPDNRVNGWVTGSDGNRVTRGFVTVGSGGRAFMTRIAADGTFSLRALPAEPVFLVARDDRTSETSSGVKLIVKDGEVVDGVELRIDAHRAINGKVVSNGEPVIGAVISIVPISSTPQTIVTTQTAMGGRFSAWVPERIDRARFTVAAPGRTLQAFEMPLTGAEITLDVAPAGGTIELTATSAFRLARNGIEVSTDQLGAWMDAHSVPEAAVLHMPDMAPGHYDVCTRGPQPHCVSGELAAGGTLRFELR